MKIAIFGGTFDPIHNGHIEIARNAIKSLNLDKLFFVPAFKNPFKKEKFCEESNHRLEMIKLVLEDKMEASTFEIDRKGVSYTIDTVQYFKNKYPNAEIYLIIGSDNLTKLPKWKEINKIVELSKIVIYRREKNFNKINAKKFDCIILNNEILEHSSTRFKMGYFEDVDSKVREYIGNNKLYIEQYLATNLSEKRFQHSLNAKNFAIEIAKANNYKDVHQASLAAFAHDIAKEVDEETSRFLIEKFMPELKNVEKYKLHQEVGYIILKFMFFIKDEEFLHSIKVHTSLAMELSTLDKIVFLADKLCRGRKWEGIQKTRDLALNNIDEAFKIVVEKTKEFNLNKGIEFSEEQKKVYEKWSKE